jgi:hypothetical protein
MTLSNRCRIYRGIQHRLLLLTTKNYGCGSLGIVGGFEEGGEGEGADCVGINGSGEGLAVSIVFRSKV